MEEGGVEIRFKLSIQTKCGNSIKYPLSTQASLASLVHTWPAASQSDQIPHCRRCLQCQVVHTVSFLQIVSVCLPQQVLNRCSLTLDQKEENIRLCQNHDVWWSITRIHHERATLSYRASLFSTNLGKPTFKGIHFHIILLHLIHCKSVEMAIALPHYSILYFDEHDH